VDVEYLNLVAAVKGSFGMVSPTADFSEVKSSPDVDNWREFRSLPKGRIAPVESDGLWSLLNGRLLVPRMVTEGVTFRVPVFRRRRRKTSARIRMRIAPPMTPPTIGPVFTDELIDGGVVADGTNVEGGDFVEAGVAGEVEEDGGTEDCDGVTTQDASSPLVTLKALDGMTPAVA